MKKTCLMVCLALAAGSAAAQTYPAKTVRMVVGFSAGGSTDVTARMVAQRLTEAWKQQVIVDNRPGAGGNIGAELVAKAPPDGYTLLVATTGVMGVNHKLYKTLPYDALRDFAPITQFGSLPLILVIHPSLPARNVKELVALAKARPGELSYASSGVGGTTHMTAEIFQMLAGVKIVHVPYKGSGQALIDVIGGQVPIAFDQITSSYPHVQAGKLRMLAISSARRFPTLPNVPTMDEAGVKGYEADSWNGLAAPAGTPRDIINRIQSEVARIVHQPDMKERLLKDGIEPIGSTPEQFAGHIRNDRAKWEKVIERAGIKPQ